MPFTLRLVRAAAFVAFAVAMTVMGAPVVGAQTEGPPPTSRSADGRSVSGAGKTLTVSQADGLATGGQTVTVSGSGYDEAKGVYVSLCVVPPPGQTPTPCGGGADRAGTSGASAWVSSDPPDYASGLSQPYGPGGTFTVQLSVSPTINAGLDCRQVACAIVTRNDHTRGSDRSQDLLVPVTFADPAAPTTAPPPTAAPTTTTSTTTTTLPPTAFAPDATLSDDGRTVSDGARSLTVSSTDDLDPAGATVTVSGEGFDPDAGIYVALCAVPEPDQTPGPCTAGTGASAWLSSSPPDYSADLARPFDDSGEFEVELTIPASIDAETDCRDVACAITTRRDDTAIDDRTADLFLPVQFAAQSPTTTSTSTTTTTEAEPVDVELASTPPTDDDGSSPWWAFALGAAAILGAGGTVAWRRRGATG